MNRFKEVLTVEYFKKIKKVLVKYLSSWIAELFIVLLLFFGTVIYIPYRPHFKNYFISDFAFFAIMLIFSGILF